MPVAGEAPREEPREEGATRPVVASPLVEGVRGEARWREMRKKPAREKV